MASRQGRSAPFQPIQSKHASTPTAKRSILQTQAELRDSLLDEYFESTKLLQVIQSFMTNLATTYKLQLRLPANPYSELLKTIRMHELRQAQSNSNSFAPLDLKVLSGQTATPSQFQVCSVEHEQFALPIWGVKSTLEQLTGVNLYSLLELVISAFQGLVIYKEFMDDDCRATAYGVLVDNSILGARAQDLQPCLFELETHVFVSGMHLEKAMAVFARFLIKRLHETANAAAVFASLPPEEAADYRGCVACGGIMITPLSTSSAVGLSPQDAASATWSTERVNESRTAFVNAVKTGLVCNSLVTLDRYDSVKLPNSDGGYLCQAEQTFFFHFDMVDGSKPNESKGVKHTTSRRSFIVGSRALATGIFFHSQGALGIAARCQTEAQAALEEEKKSQKKKQVAAITTQNGVIIPGARSRSGFVQVLQDTVDELRRIGLTNEVFRQQANCLVWCFAYSLGYLVGAHQVLEGVLCRSKCSAATAVMIQASLAGLEARVKRVLEESSLLTSVLHPVCSLIRRFYCQVKDASELEDERQIKEFVTALQCVNELLLTVIRTVFSDFIRLVRTTVTLPVAPATTNTPGNSDEIDVLRALEMAVEERKYPASIVSEAVFAQAIIDSCLDVALESAVMNTVAVCLPPNPFIDMSNNLQVFALHQLIWKQELVQTPPNSIAKISRSGSLELFSVEKTQVYAVNPRLLQLISGDQIIEAHRWLTDHHVFHDGAYKPSKSSYSVVIVPMMLIFHPLLFAKASANDSGGLSPLKELDIIEHYVLEGKELTQARLFFVEAVCTDLRRIATASGSSPGSNCWQLRAKVRVLGPHDQLVAALDLSPLTTDEILAGIIEEATQVQLLLQVVIEIAEVLNHGDSSNVTIHLVTKAYALHHRSTDDHDTSGSSTRMSPLVSFRVSEYGVFLSKEYALLCLQSIELGVCHPQDSEIPRDEWTPYASEALHDDDSFLIHELDTLGYTSQRQHCDSELINRLILHSDVCQLYSLEQAIRWLLDALQTKLQQLRTSKTRKKDIFSELPPTTVFTILHGLAFQIATQIEELVVPLNHQLQFLHKISEPLAILRKRVTRWQAIQPPTEDQLKLQRNQQEKTPDVVPLTPREDPVTITSELVDSLRTAWLLVLFFRFSYQRVFFANSDSR